jgi:hypothetical protein
MLFVKQFGYQQRERAELLLRKFQEGYQHLENDPQIYSTANKSFFRILTRTYKLQDVGQSGKLYLPFYNLSKFLSQGLGQERHFLLKDMINEVIDAILEDPIQFDKFKAKLHEVVTMIEDELLPSIDVILSDPELRLKCRAVYAVLSEENKGLDYYFKNLVRLYYFIVNIPGEDAMPAIKEINEVKELLRVLIQEKLDFNVKDGFYEIFSEYPVVLPEVLKAFTRKRDVDTNLEITASGITATTNAVRFNKRIFDVVMEEVLKNARNAYLRAGITDWPLKINFHYKPIAADPTSIQLVITQNLPFLPPLHAEHRGGLIHIVRHYVAAFGGFVDDNRHDTLSQDSKDFVLTLILKLHTYE